MRDQLGQYKILDRIGAGGLGEMYRARDTRVGRTVAIAVLPASIAGDPERRARVLQDARTAAALSHPNVAALYEIGDEHDQLFLVFEYVPGESLRSIIAGRPINARRAIHIAAQIADALADAHALGVAHRDLRPDNVIVTPKGNAKLIDVGFASWTSGDAARDANAYASPEQTRDEVVDHRADIFALGVLIYEMLTGATPGRRVTVTTASHEAGTPVGARQPADAQLPAPSTINKAAPKELDAIVGKALAPNADDRYESAATLAAELRAVDTQLAARTESALPANTVVPARGSRASVRWLVLAIVAILLGASAWYERAWLTALWRDVIVFRGR